MYLCIEELLYGSLYVSQPWKLQTKPIKGLMNNVLVGGGGEEDAAKGITMD